MRPVLAIASAELRGQLRPLSSRRSAPVLALAALGVLVLVVAVSGGRLDGAEGMHPVTFEDGSPLAGAVEGNARFRVVGPREDAVLHIRGQEAVPDGSAHGDAALRDLADALRDW